MNPGIIQAAAEIAAEDARMMSTIREAMMNGDVRTVWATLRVLVNAAEAPEPTIH